jgi:hypothetical protein
MIGMDVSVGVVEKRVTSSMTGMAASVRSVVRRVTNNMTGMAASARSAVKCATNNMTGICVKESVLYAENFVTFNTIGMVAHAKSVGK